MVLARSSWSPPPAVVHFLASTGAFGILLWVLVILAIIALVLFLVRRL